MTPRETATALQLVRGLLSGLWTLDDLDRPSPAWRELEDARLASARPDDRRPPWERHSAPPLRYPDAGTIRPWRNLAREWIDANPVEWQAMQDRECGVAHAP